MQIELSEVKPGMKVRLIYEGVVSKAGNTWVRFEGSMALPAGSQGFFAAENATIELVEPEYIEGGLYQDSNGDPFQYEGAGYNLPGDPPFWWQMGTSIGVPFDEPRRPLRRLVPEVQPG